LIFIPLGLLVILFVLKRIVLQVGLPGDDLETGTLDLKPKKGHSMKRLIIILAIMLLPGATAFCQNPTQTPLTQAQIETRLKNVQIEKRYLELQVEEQNLNNALKEIAKPEVKKEKAK
jgi:hypothetical protein